jgi:hypothetical protein
LALGAPTGIQFNGGDPAAGLASNSGDTTGAVGYPNVFGLSDLALAALSSINGLPETSPGPPNPSYVGAGFFSPNSVTSSGSPYAYVGGDPIDGVDPDGEFSIPGFHDVVGFLDAGRHLAASVYDHSFDFLENHGILDWFHAAETSGLLDQVEDDFIEAVLAEENPSVKPKPRCRMSIGVR